MDHFFCIYNCVCRKFDVLNDPEEVVIDFRESKIADMSAIDAVHNLTERYAKEGKRFICHLCRLS
jgi:SulP family sulfate permease